MAEKAAADDFVQQDDMGRIIIYEPAVSALPGIVFGGQAIVCSLWWILIMFVYVKNTSADTDLYTIGNVRTVPIGWWWERIAEYQGKSIYLGLSLMFSWLFLGAVSVVELVAWIMYMYDNMWFARWYFRTIGYWGTILFFGIPTVFAFVQAGLQSTNVFPGSWTLFQLISSFIIWITTMLIHIYFIDDFIVFIDSQYSPSCFCDWPSVKEQPDDQEKDTV